MVPYLHGTKIPKNAKPGPDTRGNRPKRPGILRVSFREESSGTVLGNAVYCAVHSDIM